MKDRSIALSRSRRKAFVAGVPVMPMYAFALLFVAGPLVYMVILSFLKRSEIWGFLHEFTIENYANIMEPVYLKTFYESLKLAGLSTALVALIGYPFGYFMAKLRLMEAACHVAPHDPLLDQLCSGSTDGSSFSSQRNARPDTHGDGFDERAAETALHVPGCSCGHGICLGSIHDLRGLLQR